jgi:ribosomal protein S8
LNTCNIRQKESLEDEGFIQSFDVTDCYYEYEGDWWDQKKYYHRKRCEDVEKCYRKYTKAPFDEKTKKYTLDYKYYIKTCNDIKQEEIQEQTPISTPISPPEETPI